MNFTELQQRVSNFIRQELIPIIENVSNARYLQTNNRVSVEINAEYIKLLKLRFEDQFHIENFAFIPLPQDLVVKNEIKDMVQMVILLKEQFSKLFANTKSVIIAINHSSIIAKTININIHLNSDEIEARVWSEADRLFPNLIRDIMLDYVILGPSFEDPNKLDVLVVACRKDHIKPYLDLMRDVDLTLQAVDVNCYALERGASLIYEQAMEKTHALLNIGFSLITLIVAHENDPLFSYEVTYDGRGLLTFIQENPGTNFTDILHKTLSLHIKHTMQFFYTSKPNIRVEKIFLSGDCAAVIPDLEHFIHAETGKNITLADPFKKMTVSPSLNQQSKEKLHQYAPAFVQCCGLALSKLED